jgi:hypothetical protein
VEKAKMGKKLTVREYLFLYLLSEDYKDKERKIRGGIRPPAAGGLVLLNAFNVIQEGVYGSEVGGLQDSTTLDYRLVVFGGFSPYVMVRGVDDKWALAEAERWHGCVDVSRELALYLCPY